MKNYSKFIDYSILLFHLSLNDIKQKFKRTHIGPLWNVLSSLVVILSIFFIFSIIFNDVNFNYFRHLSFGIVIWFYIANTINEGLTSITNSGPLIRNIPLNPIFFITRSVLKNYLIFFNSLLAICLINLIFGFITINEILVCFFFSFLLFIFLFLLIIIFSVINVFFHDFQYLISNILQIVFYLTPVVWNIEQIGASFKIKMLLSLNPFMHFMDLIRSPNDLNDPSTTFFAVIIYFIFAFIGATICYKKFFKKISLYV